MEKKFIDLHTHTIYSDGELTPAKIVEFSAVNGINILAISDHDNTKGYFEGIKTAEEHGITLIPGVEITTPKYHLLALNFDPFDSEFQSFLEKSRKLQRKACIQRIEILQKEGIPITIEKVEKEFPNARVGKGNLRLTLQKDPECRKFLSKKHPNLSPIEIFKIYLGDNGVASNLEPRAGVAPLEAIEAVHKAGGIIGLAHPPKDVDDISELDHLVRLGIDFLEVQPNLKAKYPYLEFEDYARINGLPVTYGSDYHGPTGSRPMLRRGENILTYDVARLLRLSQEINLIQQSLYNQTP